MFNAPAPPPSELPSPRALLRSTAIAVVIAGALLVTVVLPAEYGIDPTGVGRPLGLTRMGEIKAALALEAEADAAAHAAASQGTNSAELTAAPTVDPSRPSEDAWAGRENLRTLEIPLQPGQSRELKLAMKRGATVHYEWSTDWGPVSFDLNGHPANPPAGFYHGYAKDAARVSDEGDLEAAFDGMHGWIWRNNGNEVVTVTLRVAGDYQDLREIERSPSGGGAP